MPLNVSTSRLRFIFWPVIGCGFLSSCKRHLPTRVRDREYAGVAEQRNQALAPPTAAMKKANCCKRYRFARHPPSSAQLLRCCNECASRLSNETSGKTLNLSQSPTSTFSLGAWRYLASCSILNQLFPQRRHVVISRGKYREVTSRMNFQTPLSSEDSARYAALVEQGTAITRHAELLEWLQGDIQLCLPHDILLAGWGNFQEGVIQHDVVSRLPGARSYAAGTDSLPFLTGKVLRLLAGRRQAALPP
jgi:hypothetical protein